MPIELVEKRTRNSKTFLLQELLDGRKHYAWNGVIGAIHYKEQPHSPQSPWLDIDTTIVNGKVRKAPFDLDIFLHGLPGFRYKSKGSGEFIVRINTAREDTGKPTILPNLVQPRIEGNRVIWENIYPDTDVILEVETTKVHLKRLLKSDKAPFEFDIDIQEIQKGIAKLLPLRPATDANGQRLVMVEEKIAGGRRELLKLEVISTSGEVKPITYPILDNVTVDEQVGAGADDGIRYDSTFNAAFDWVVVGNDGDINDNFMRFTTVGVPQGATISVAYLTFKASNIKGGTTVYTELIGNDADNAVAPTNSNEYNNLVRTTAVVNWDSLPTWYTDTDYNTPSIVSIIQEIVDRGGWASNNAMQILVEDDGSSTNASRWAHSYDGSSANAPKLHIEYTVVTAPTVTTQAVSDIGTTTATGNGNITATGGENCDKRGIVYGTSSQGDPGDVAPGSSGYDDYEEETDSFGTGAFTRSLTGLTPGQKYYARAYAHNSEGYSYGGEVEFRATYDETGKVQTILAVAGKAEVATFTELEKEQVILVPVTGNAWRLYTDLAREQVVLAVLAKAEQLIIGETVREQTIQAVLSSIGNQTMSELDKLQTTLVVIGGDAYKRYTETGREQVILGVLAKVEQLVKVETGKEQVVLVALSRADLVTFSEEEKLQLLLGVITGDAYKRYTETEKAQIVLAVLAKGEQLIKGEVGREQIVLTVISETEQLTRDEVGREQVVLGVVGESDLQSMLETAKLQVTLAVVGRSDYQSYLETGKEQIIITVQTAVDSPLLTELGRTQTILAVVTEADAFFKYLTALKYTLELHNSDGDLISILQNARDISYAQMINSPFILNFVLPADDPKASDILLSNEIWLRDYRSGSVIKKFRLSREKDIR